MTKNIREDVLGIAGRRNSVTNITVISESKKLVKYVMIIGKEVGS